MADEPFFVEGVSVSCRFLNPDLRHGDRDAEPDAEAYYTDNVFE